MSVNELFKGTKVVGRGNGVYKYDDDDSLLGLQCFYLQTAVV